ncbi:MAG: gluconate 2-dehydrogenase subunit 3 family protein, partial [Gammaproteobacteria bacterium]
MDKQQQSRRAFLKASGSLAGSTWFLLHSPAIFAAGKEAAKARDSNTKFANLTAAEALEFEAIAAQIIPTDDTPGAREAGVIYFIDQAFGSFMAGAAPSLREGLEKFQADARAEHPDTKRFSALAPERQIEFLESQEASPFFQTMRYLTLAGMFSLPMYGGNRGEIG